MGHRRDNQASISTCIESSSMANIEITLEEVTSKIDPVYTCSREMKSYSIDRVDKFSSCAVGFRGALGMGVGGAHGMCMVSVITDSLINDYFSTEVQGYNSTRRRAINTCGGVHNTTDARCDPSTANVHIVSSLSFSSLVFDGANFHI